jgi:Mg2+ and Co2+ transporter CorA
VLRLDKALRSLLRESVLGFLAIVALALALAPWVFPLSRPEQVSLESIEGLIVAVFALEYVVSMLEAPDKLAFVRSGWRLLDLVVILGPLVALLLPWTTTLGATPALRLLRVLAFSARLSGLAVQRPAAALAPLRLETARITVLSGTKPPSTATWEEVRTRLHEPPVDEWYHASGLDRSQVAEVARDAGISPAFMQTLGETEYPRVEVYDRFSVLFTFIPELGTSEDATIARTGVLVLATDYGVLSVARHGIPLQEDIQTHLDDLALPKCSFATRSILAILKLVLRRYEEVAGHLERHARELELAPLRESRTEFLERTFKIQRQVATLKSDLWRLKGILNAFAEGRLPFHSLSAAAGRPNDLQGEQRLVNEQIRILVDEASYVYETVFNAREGLLSLIDLHLNVVSFEMNKVMRFLALVTAMGLVPAIVSGFLGMNVLGQPFPIALHQVVFLVAVGVMLLLYTFFVKGWLR